MAINAFQAGVNTVSATNINLDENTLTDGDIIIWDSAGNYFVNARPTSTNLNIPTDLDDFTNGPGFVTQAQLTQQIANINTGGSVDLTLYATQAYVNNQISNINLFDGDYNSLTNLPTIINFSGDYNDLTNAPNIFSGDYDDLINKPTIFSGNYNDLVNQPAIPDISGLATETYVNTQISNIVDSDSQTLALSGTDLSISSGNTIDVSTLQQTLSLSGTTLTISGTNGNVVDLSTFSGISSSSIGDLVDIDISNIQNNQFLRWNGTSFITISLDASDLLDNTGRFFDGDYNSLTNRPNFPNDLLDLNITDGTAGQVLKTDGQGAFFFADETGGGGGGGGIELTDLSVQTQGASGAGSLSYSASNGRFTFRPADLSTYINQSQLSTQLGSYVTQSSLNSQLANVLDLTDFSVTTATASGSGSLAYDDSTGVFTFTPPDLSGMSQGSHYTDSDVDTHLNVSTATTGQVLAWNGTDYVWTTQSGGGGAAEHIQWTTSGTDNELRISEQWLETGNTYSVRSVSINNDNLLEVELATFSPTVSASGQSLSWDQTATQFSISIDNPTDFTSRYIDAVNSIGSATGVHATLSDYTAGAKSQAPAGGVDWTQTFSTNATATIVSNGTGLTGGSASATIEFADNAGVPWANTDTISYNWQNASVTGNFASLTGKNFLESYNTVNYTITVNGLYDAGNASTTVTPTGGTLSNASGSGTFTFTDSLHKDNNTGRSISVTTAFTRPAGVTGSGYTVNDTYSDTTISANFTYPSFYIWQTDVSTIPTNTDIVDGSDFHADVNELGNQIKDINTTINNTDANPRAFWFGVRTGASQPTTFQTGPSSSLLSDTNVATGNTVTLQPTSVPTGYTGESYTLYGITLQPGQTYVRIT